MKKPTANQASTILNIVLIWFLIYYFYHYYNKSRRQQLDTLKLESLVKELELKTIKAHINPHFIFNSINSIRALVDENPQRARKAITELSNILRSSMQTEKMETVPLENELRSIKDYLALESMRFEDRLKVEYAIDEDTLNQPIPPMMLQTLVENAIKHGISRQINGGVVKVISDFKGDYHELAVQNTGQLNGDINKEGFGLSSTTNRLNLLYGEKARFEIKQVNGSLVEARFHLSGPGGGPTTFAMRDVLSPVAAELCNGAALDTLGPTVDPADLLPGVVPLPHEEPGAEGRVLVGEVLSVDRFGNCELNISPDALSDPVSGTFIETTLIRGIRANASSPQLAADIANAIGDELILLSPSGPGTRQEAIRQQAETQIACLQETIRATQAEIDQLANQIQQTTEATAQRALIIRLDERRSQAFLTGLTLFWLIRSFTGDDWFAFSGGLLVAAGGALFAGERAIRETLRQYRISVFPRISTLHSGYRSARILCDADDGWPYLVGRYL